MTPTLTLPWSCPHLCLRALLLPSVVPALQHCFLSPVLAYTEPPHPEPADLVSGPQTPSAQTPQHGCGLVPSWGLERPGLPWGHSLFDEVVELLPHRPLGLVKQDLGA